VAVKWWIGAVLVVAAAAECPRVRAADPDTRPATRPGDGVDYVRRLARSLDQGPPASRTEAAQRLAEINNPESRAAITAALTSPDDRTQAAAAHAASEATSPDPAWVAPLSAILDRTQNPETAGQAALALAGFDQEPRAYEALIRAAQAHRTGQIQAINAMGRVVQKRVAATLLALSNGAAESAAVHEAAAGALARISPQTSRTDGGVAWTRW
jgi:HEAT repeat protein